ncbi:protein LLP homolog isoform X1 [Clavelina lepadiformis]|uniref:protein LLP homolog isoform X1 n=1 Tax=Clavelina lepadiformis TaxID=159417 RepID=UPI00404357A6
MAKSLRSKWKRKMRAVKREKNDKRVLSKLKETLKEGKVVMTEDMCKFAQQDILIQQRKDKEIEQNVEMQADSEATMELDKKRNRKTLLDDHGQYPSWVNARQAKRLRAQRKKSKNGTIKKIGRNKKLLW